MAVMAASVAMALPSYVAVERVAFEATAGTVERFVEILRSRICETFAAFAGLSPQDAVHSGLAASAPVRLGESQP